MTPELWDAFAGLIRVGIDDDELIIKVIGERPMNNDVRSTMTQYDFTTEELQQMEATNKYQPANILNMTLPEAMHMALDGAKVCHDGVMKDRSIEYVFFNGSQMLYRHKDGYADVFLSNISSVPKEGWRIYKEPAVTYKGWKNVITALEEGKGLECVGCYGSISMRDGTLTVISRKGIETLVHFNNTWTVVNNE